MPIFSFFMHIKTRYNSAHVEPMRSLFMTETPKITLQDIKDRCDPKIFQRGKAYYEEGAIKKPKCDGNEIRARCLGSYSQPYRVSVQLGDEGIVWAECDCPYDYGGDCKHIVALLLTYMYQPMQFAELSPTTTSTPQKSNHPLNSRTKSELITIIEQMVKQYPDLQRIVDNPTPPAFDVPYRQKLRQAARHYANRLNEQEAALQITAIATVADQFAESGEWEKAINLYCAILEEFVVSIVPSFSFQGFFALAINAVVQSVERCFEHITETSMRSSLLNALVGLWIWQVRRDKPGVGLDAHVLLYATIQAQDVPAIHAQIKAQDGFLRHESQRAKHHDFIKVIDQIHVKNIDGLIAELSKQGMIHAFIKRLLMMGQVDVVGKVLDLSQGVARVNGLRVIWKSGHEELALQLAKDGMASYLDGDVIEWVLKMCRKHDSYQQVVLEWLLWQVRYTRNIQHYQDLKASATKLNVWGEFCQQVIDDIQASGDYALLIDIYLHDEQWDKAWKILPKAMSFPEEDNAGLDLTVAQMTRYEYPERAIPVYMKYVHRHIQQRTREQYVVATTLLIAVMECYEQLDEFEKWEKVIKSIRAEYKLLRALHEELKRCGL
jgi:uncharacterized Zn finger protein